MTEVKEYRDTEGNSPCAKWFDRLNVAAAVKVATVVHRIYFGKDGDWLVIFRGWYQEVPGCGYFGCIRALERL